MSSLPYRIRQGGTRRRNTPKETLWDEIREKIFKNYALKSIDAVRTKLKQAILYRTQSKTRPINHLVSYIVRSP